MSVSAASFVLAGGVDYASSYLSTKPGRAIDALNYECLQQGGYRRIAGYQMFDGSNVPAGVPGVGPLRGVWSYRGRAYAVRDQDELSAAMYRSSPTGWELVELGSFLRYDNAGDEFAEGEVVTGASSGATANIQRVVYGGGLIDDQSASGLLSLGGVTGAFQDNEQLLVDGNPIALANGELEAATLLPGGKYRFHNHNFYGQASGLRMYGVDGLGLIFEYDGDVFCPIEIDGAGDSKPTTVAAHKNHLFLGFTGGSILTSSIGAPLEYNALTGAAEIPVGDEVRDLEALSGGALAIGCARHVSLLYGNDADTWQLQKYSNAGVAADTMLEVSGSVLVLNQHGVQSLTASNAYGDFSSATVSLALADRILALARSDADAVSVVNRGLSQYRIFFGQTGYYFTYSGTKLIGVMPVRYAHPVLCACNDQDESGNEVSYFGTDDGFVMKMDTTNFFAGQPLPSRLWLAFNHLGAPTRNKQFRRMVLDARVEGEAATMYGRALFNFGAGPSEIFNGPSINGGSAPFWDAPDWNAFNWSTPLYAQLVLDTEGSGENMGVLVLHEGIEDTRFALYSATLHFSLRGLNR